MLEHYFVRPTTVDRIRSSWLGESIEQYVTWLHENKYSSRNIFSRVPLLVQFGKFAQDNGATSKEQLSAFIDAFVADWVNNHNQWCRNATDLRCVENATRNPIVQLLRLIQPDNEYCISHDLPTPFAIQAPGFFIYLRQERGLKETTIGHYRRYLRQFEQYLKDIKLERLSALSIPVVSGFITESSCRLSKNSLRYPVGVLRVFLTYLYREKIIAEDLCCGVEQPQNCRLATVPRSISWEEVRLLLANVDQRSPVGKRDYAILMLLATYGLRAREVAALTLDSIDWRRERLCVSERKADHTTAYPLSPVVGEAIINYVQDGRPKTKTRELFFSAMAPYRPITWASVSQRVAYHIHNTGIQIPHAGAHTLRHTCVQRLIDADFSLKTIGDYVGHRSPDATEVYTKVAIEALRQIALGDGEDIV